LALGEAGASEVGVWARRPEAAQSASRLVTQGDRLERPDPEGWDVIVNGTPVGMGPGDPSPLVGAVSAGQVVVELVYASGETALERQAGGADAVVVGGPEVLLHQAGAAFELWTGMAAPLGAMEVALRDAQDRGTMDR
jgi:shikimate dehydrogenase